MGSLQSAMVVKYRFMFSTLTGSSASFLIDSLKFHFIFSYKDPKSEMFKIYVKTVPYSKIVYMYYTNTIFYFL